MDTAMPEEHLKEILDRIIREVTKDSVGIHLIQGEPEPGADVCTVHISFHRGFRSSLSLRADTAMLTQLARSMLDVEEVTPQDLEDSTKEYFNVLCGRIAAALYKATRVAARFSAPSFYRGSYSPEDQEEQFVLSYAGGQEGAAQLIHHIPAPQNGEVGAKQDQNNFDRKRDIKSWQSE